LIVNLFVSLQISSIVRVTAADRHSTQAHRRDLLEIMTSFIPLENVKFSKRLTTIEEHHDKIILKFADGEFAEASVLAGADGIKSSVRKYVLEPLYPEQVDPVYADAYCYRAVIPMSEADEIMGDLTDVAKFYFGYDRSAVSYRITGGKVGTAALREYRFEIYLTHKLPQEFNFLLCVADPNPWKLDNAVTETVSHEAMMDDFASESIDERFRQLLSKANPIKWGLFHHPHTSTYYRGRVVLLGDSAHASLPFQAAGAAQGLEDALVLSSVLAELGTLHKSGFDVTPQIEAGFEAYDSVRRPRAQKQLEQSAEVSRMILFQHEKAGDDMSKILPMLQEGRFDWLWFHDIDGDVAKAVAEMKDK
jgi:salicylate hydroxylase